MSEEKNIKNLLKDYFSKKSDIDTVLLFGSFAKGSYNSHSDVDIAIHSHLPLDYEKNFTDSNGAFPFMSS